MTSAPLYPRTGIIEGYTPNHYSTATAVIGTAVQTVGSGQSDLTSGGTYTAVVDHVYTIVIHTDGGHFQWKTDNGSFSGDVAITGSAQTLANGVTVTFGHTSGYTVADTFVITVTAGVIISAFYLGKITVNAAGSGGQYSVYNGTSSAGTLIVNVTSPAVGNTNYGYKLSNGIYFVLYASSSYPDMIVGTE